MKEKINELTKKINFFSFSFVSIIGLSMFPELFLEDDPSDKIDDALIVLLGIAGIVWYKKTGHKSNKTTGSIIMFILAILIKIMAIVIERADKEAVGDDIGVLITFVFGFIFTLFMIWKKKKLAEK